MTLSEQRAPQVSLSQTRGDSYEEHFGVWWLQQRTESSQQGIQWDYSLIKLCDQIYNVFLQDLRLSFRLNKSQAAHSSLWTHLLPALYRGLLTSEQRVSLYELLLHSKRPFLDHSQPDPLRQTELQTRRNEFPDQAKTVAEFWIQTLSPVKKILRKKQQLSCAYGDSRGWFQGQFIFWSLDAAS